MKMGKNIMNHYYSVSSFCVFSRRWLIFHYCKILGIDKLILGLVPELTSILTQLNDRIDGVSCKTEYFCIKILENFDDNDNFDNAIYFS